LDWVVIAYYSIVCSLLAAIVPQVSGLVRRIVAGATVGSISAAALQSVRALIGA